MSNLPSQETLRDFAENLPLANPWAPRSVPQWISRNASTNIKAVLRIVFYLDKTYIDHHIDCPKNGCHILRAATGRGSRFGSIEDCMGRNPFPCGCRRPPSLPKRTRDLAQQCFDIWHCKFKDTENRIREHFKPEIQKATRRKDMLAANTLRAQKSEALKTMVLPVTGDSQYSIITPSAPEPSLLQALDRLDSQMSQHAAGPSTPTSVRAVPRKPAPFPMVLPTPPDSSPVKPPTPKSFHSRGDTVDSPIEISDESDKELGSSSSRKRALSPIGRVEERVEEAGSSRSIVICVDGNKRRRGNGYRG
ncbi:hypothetical protein VNI00_003071 [Paramarasmius palmivorus]|uniref:Uncharacterized protein n=1 Tax=Paramarasmius palmivorus TaxID=297713 RepID=A0AAW0DXZ9_9AGAR